MQDAASWQGGEQSLNNNAVASVIDRVARRRAFALQQRQLLVVAVEVYGADGAGRSHAALARLVG